VKSAPWLLVFRCGSVISLIHHPLHRDFRPSAVVANPTRSRQSSRRKDDD
jgi:hypothetical protein